MAVKRDFIFTTHALTRPNVKRQVVALWSQRQFRR